MTDLLAPPRRCLSVRECAEAAGAPGFDEVPAESAPRSRGRRVSTRRLLSVLVWIATLAGVGLLAAELRSADPLAMLRTVHIGWLLAALGCTGGSLVAAAYNLHGFATVPLRASATLRAQLAVGFTRVLMPSAVSTPAVAARYLNRSGASWPLALGTVSAAQLAQLIVTTLVVAALSLVSPGQDGMLDLRVDPVTAAIVAASLAAGTVAAVLAGRRLPIIRRGLDGVAANLATLGRHARERPGRIVVGVLAGAALTCTHVLAFACCVYAVGGGGALLPLAVVYLAGSATGSLVPTPGGTGAVEAALVAGLTAAGLSLPVALAATLLSRLESVWLPAVPGWFALRRMRRDGLL